MAVDNPDQVILALCRDDVPEARTLRDVLKWLAPESTLMPDVNPLSSLEEARERVRFAELLRLWEAARANEHAQGEKGSEPTPEGFTKPVADWVQLVREMGPMKAPPRLDDATIDRIAAA